MDVNCLGVWQSGHFLLKGALSVWSVAAAGARPAPAAAAAAAAAAATRVASRDAVSSEAATEIDFLDWFYS